MGVGTREDALRDIREVIRLTPDSYLGYVSEGRYWKEAGDFEMAEWNLLNGLSKLGDGFADKKIKDEINLEITSIQTSHFHAEAGPQINHDSTPPQILYLHADTSPFSTLPLEIFVEILPLASVTMEAPAYTSRPTPLLKPPKKDFLISAMSVSRAWYHAISDTPHFWEILKLDGVLNRRNGYDKILGRIERFGKVDEGQTVKRKGLKRLVITAAGEANLFKEWLEQIRDSRIAHELEELVISFIDIGKDKTEDLGTFFESFLYKTCGKTLKSFTWCSATTLKVYNSLPDPDRYPRLQHLRLYSPSSLTGRSSLFRLLSCPTYAFDMNYETSPLVTLCIEAILIPENHYFEFQAPKLEHVEIRSRGGSDKTGAQTLVALDVLKVLCLENLALAPPAAWDPKKLQTLEELSITHSRAGRQLLRTLCRTTISLAHLTRLSLIEIQLSRNFEELEYLNCPSLTYLCLIRVSTSTPTQSLNMAAFPFLPELLSLKWRNSYIDPIDNFLEHLPSRAPKLRELNLDFSKGLSISMLTKYCISRMDTLQQISSLQSEYREEGRPNQENFPVLDQLSLSNTGIFEGSVKEIERYIKPGGLKADKSPGQIASYFNLH